MKDREHRRRRMRRHGRRAYIRSVYFLPSLATLGNAVCGFAAMYVASLADTSLPIHDSWTRWWQSHAFTYSAYLIFVAMIFDGLDGRLARFARHTTDFGGQLDSLADVVSFGAAPAFIALQLFHFEVPLAQVSLSRLIWAIGALYFSCAAIRLARFNVSNKHGEQHHFSFLGLPSPGAAGAVAAWILMEQDLLRSELPTLARIALFVMPIIVLATGLLMVSDIRYPHVVNRYMRGKRSFGRVLAVLALLLLLIVWHEYTLAICTVVYAFYGFALWIMSRIRKAHPTSAA